MQTQSKIVIGLGYGDEGKGHVVSWLCSKTQNALVVRFNGGHQAGHTVNYNGKRHVFSSFGSGSLQDIPTYWNKYCTFNPVAFVKEYKLLDKPLIYVNPLCPVTTPFDIAFNQICEQNNSNGSVGVGFGATIQRQQDHFTLFVQDLFYEKIVREKLRNISHYYDCKSSLNKKEKEADEFFKSIDEVKKIITLADDSIMNNYTPIFEGAQGILLDQDHGFFPNVTRSYTTSKNAFENFYKRPEEVYYVTRTYQTRHGKGFMSNEGYELKLKNNENETNKSHAYQGEFRTGPIDIELLNYALKCDANYASSLIKKNLVITCIDQHEIDVNELLNKLDVHFDNIFISHGETLNDIKPFFQS